MKYILSVVMGILLINQAVAMDMDRLETARNNLNSVIDLWIH